jgi:hypothetical protein
VNIFVVIVVVLVAAIAIVLGLASSKPDVFRLARSTQIKASPEAIAAWIVDFHNWTQWSPWEGVPGDELKRGYSGPASGVGAVYEWTGKKTGVGRMEMIEISPKHVGIKLDFFKPFEAHNVAEFTLEPSSEKGVTAVTWSMHGPAPLMVKVMHLFMNMDKMVGPSFEQGLSRLKGLAEG